MVHRAGPLVILLLLGFAGTAAAASVTVEEFFDAERGLGSFTVTNGTPDRHVAAFAVANNSAVGSWTFRSGWSSIILNPQSWGGYSFVPESGVTVHFGMIMGPVSQPGGIHHYLGSFWEYFDAQTYSQAIVYHADYNTFGTPPAPNYIGPGGSDGGFAFTAAEPDSPYFVILADGTVLGPFDTDQGAPIPEPGSLALFGLGLAGIGLHLRRRRKGERAPL